MILFMINRQNEKGPYLTAKMQLHSVLLLATLAVVPAYAKKTTLCMKRFKLRIKRISRSKCQVKSRELSFASNLHDDKAGGNVFDKQ